VQERSPRSAPERTRAEKCCSVIYLSAYRHPCQYEMQPHFNNRKRDDATPAPLVDERKRMHLNSTAHENSYRFRKGLLGEASYGRPGKPYTALHACRESHSECCHTNSIRADCVTELFLADAGKTIGSFRGPRVYKVALRKFTLYGGAVNDCSCERPSHYAGEDDGSTASISRLDFSPALLIREIQSSLCGVRVALSYDNRRPAGQLWRLFERH
jgi:hypothetical protein